VLSLVDFVVMQFILSLEFTLRLIFPLVSRRQWPVVLEALWQIRIRGKERAEPTTSATTSSRGCAALYSFHPSTDYKQCNQVPNWISLKTRLEKEIGSDRILRSARILGVEEGLTG
jgi:hypothetical protein